MPELASGQQLPSWAVDTEPLLGVGVRDGADAEMFVRVRDATRLPDGGLAVLDAGAKELRFFNARGSSTAVSGRAGEGPGEFKGPFGVEVLAGDSVVVWDYSRGRLSFWSTEGDFVAERSAEHHWTAHEGELLPDGSVVVPKYDDDPQPPSGRYRPPARLIRYARGQAFDLGSFPFEEVLARAKIGIRMPFTAKSAMAAGGSPMRIAICEDTSRPLVRIVDGTGELIREVRIRGGLRPIPEQHWKAEVEAVRQRFGRRPAVEQFLSDWGRPDYYPALDALGLDALGRLWVIQGEGEAKVATVYIDGDPVAEVRLPRLSAIFEIGADYILGLHEDEMGVQAVRVYGYTEGRGALDRNR